MVREKFGGGAALLGLHDRIADVLLTATALSAESPGICKALPAFLSDSVVWNETSCIVPSVVCETESIFDTGVLCYRRPKSWLLPQALLLKAGCACRHRAAA